MSQAKNPSQLWSELIIDQLIKNDICDFFVCPGMRNAPLLRAIAHNKMAQITTGFDERAQSYCALGNAKMTKRPSVLVCTSGSAVANFLPAVIEAQKSRLPLIILSADRPGELAGSDANQTINQIEVLRNYTKSFWHLSEPHSDYPPHALASQLCHHISTSIQAPQGVVHLNIPLREPIDETPKEMDPKWVETINKIIQSPMPALKIAPITKELSEEVILNISTLINQSQRPLVVIGELTSPINYDALKEFLSAMNCNFAIDITGQHKFNFGALNGLIPALDHPEVLTSLEQQQHDLIIHIGHRQTSKHYYSFLKKMRTKAVQIIQICHTSFHEDPGHAFSARFNVDPAHLIEKLVPKIDRPNSEFIDFSSMIEKKASLIQDSPLSYPFLSKESIDRLNNLEAIFIGNSTFIRSFDSYCSITPKDFNTKVLANRGASGIEGHLATSFAMAKKASGPTAAFIGDVSTLHDLGSLSYFYKKEFPMLVVIVNNAGGGIFNLLPIAKEQPDYLDLLTTPHSIDLTKVCLSMEINCQKITSKEDYINAIENWKKEPKLQFLEVIVKNSDNLAIYNLLKTIKL